MKYETIAFTKLELKALWLLATGAILDTTDDLLVGAGCSAVDKVYRAERGMKKKPTPPIHPHKPTCGGIDVRRRPE